MQRKSPAGVWDASRLQRAEFGSRLRTNRPDDRRHSSDSGKTKAYSHSQSIPETGLKDIVGQADAVGRLQQFAALYRRKSRRIEHILLLGSLGSGRATLAGAFARDNDPRREEYRGFSGQIHELAAASLQSADQLSEVGGGFLILREVNQLRRAMVPTVSALLDTFILRVPQTLGRWKTVEETKVEPFTCIATVTKMGDCPDSLLRRFSLRLSLRPYSQTELQWIAARLAWQSGFRLEPAAALSVARVCDGTPSGIETLVRHLKLIGKISLSENDVRGTLAVFGSVAVDSRGTSLDPTIDRLSGTEFERLVLALMKAMGFRAEMTKATGDGGIDLEAVLEGDSLLKGRYIVQCKRLSTFVGVKIVREFYGVLTSAPETVKGILITNTGFTDQAREFAKGTRLELVDGNQLHALLSKHGIRHVGS